MKLRKVLLPLLICSLLTGCWQAEPEEAEALTPLSSLEEEHTEPPVSSSITTDVFSLPYAPGQTVDPLTCSDGMQQTISSLLYEGLFRLNEQFEPEPWLCESYHCIPSDREEDPSCTYTFVLRSGVFFSDGTPLTAEDVKDTLIRAQTSPRYGARFRQVRSISAEDNTVTITLTSPNTGFPALLDIPIVKRSTASDPIPCGTGPYLFSSTDTTAYLVANQSWWRGETLPIDRISLAEAADYDTMLYRFSTHDVQLVTADLIGTNPITATGNISYHDANTTVLQYVSCNTTRAPLNNVMLRRALSIGFNRSLLVSAFLSGHAAATHFPVSPVSPLYPHHLEERYSMEAFTEALTLSGYIPEQPLVLLVNSENSFKVAVSNYLATAYTAAGVPVNVQALPWEEYTAALNAGEFDLYYGEVKLTADWNLTDLVGTDGTLNFCGKVDPMADQLLSSFSTAEDRVAAMEALCSHLRTQATLFPICFKSTSVLTQSDVLENLISTMTEPFYGITDCTIHLNS